MRSHDEAWPHQQRAIVEHSADGVLAAPLPMIRQIRGSMTSGIGRRAPRGIRTNLLFPMTLVEPDEMYRILFTAASRARAATRPARGPRPAGIAGPNGERGAKSSAVHDALPFILRRIAIVRYFAVMCLIIMLCGCADNGASTIGPRSIVPQSEQNAALAFSARSRTAAAKCPASGESGILPDGDFSQAPYPGAFESVSKGAKFAPDWTSSGPQGIDFVGSYFATPNGLCSIDLDGTPGPGGIEHSAFPTTIGATYSVSFLFSGNGACSPTEKLMQVEAAGKSKQYSWNLSTRGAAQNGNYRKESWSFTATATTTTLKIYSKDPSNSYCGPVVSKISVISG